MVLDLIKILKLVRSQIIKTGNGVTRINLSKARFKTIRIPVPSVCIQEKIVEILDLFTPFIKDISSELNLEIKARQSQYEYYRNLLLSFPKPEEVK